MMEKVISEFIKLCSDGYALGWHERNGGNLSYRMKDEDVKETRHLMKKEGRHYDLPLSCSGLSGEYFLITGSGKYMRNVSLAPEENIGIIRLDDDGKGYTILWGLENGAKPTSEIPTHLLNHEVRKKVSGGTNRVIYHAHPANITALSYTIEPDAKTLTRILWQSETECAVVFPEGVGILDWMMPGSVEIGVETSRLIGKYRAVVWAFHGIFGCGDTLDEAFGLIHTIEKAAEIYLKAKSAGIIRSIKDEDLVRLASYFSVNLNTEFIEN